MQIRGVNAWKDFFTQWEWRIVKSVIFLAKNVLMRVLIVAWNVGE